MEALKQRPAFLLPHQLTPDHVRGLSIGEVGEMFSTLGLYVRTQHELAEHGLAENPEVKFALDFGMTMHANDRRTNGAYNDHILRVGLRILTKYRIDDPSIIAASFLHDCIEDHPRDTARALGGGEAGDAHPQAHAMLNLRRFVGAETADIVEAVTNPPFDDDQKNEQYAAHTQAIVFNDPKAAVLKLSDFTDNAVGNHHTRGDKQTKLDRKYLACYRIHKMGLFMPDSLITGDVRDYVLNQLTLGHLRATGRLALELGM